MINRNLIASLTSRTSRCLLVALAALMVFLAYCNTLYSPPLLDDFHSFINDDKVYLDDISLNSLRSISGTKFGWERWIPMVSFAINHKFSHGELIHFHITNILIHIFVFISCCIMIRILLTIKYKPIFNDNTIIFYFSLSIACLWALNPVQTNAVTYLVQRMTSIQALFYTMSIVFYLNARWAQLSSNSSKYLITCYYIGCVLSALGAFLSKQNSAMLPFMLIMTEMWFFKPELPSRLWNRLKMSSWSTWLVIAFVTLLCAAFAASKLSWLDAAYENRHFTLLERLLTQPRIVIWYVSLLLFPLPSRLSLEHDVIVSKSLFEPLSTFPSLVMIVGGLWLVFHYRHRLPLITFGFLWFFMNLAIESTFLPLEMIFEHRLYLPSMGLVLAVAAGAVQFSRHLFRRTAEREFLLLWQCSFVILFSGLAILTFIRNEAWESQITLNYDAALKAPDNPRAHANLAVAFLRVGAYDQAVGSAEKALAAGRENYEEYCIAANSIVLAHLKKGEPEKAVQRGEEFIRNRPRKVDMRSMPFLYLNLSEAYLQLERMEDAFRIAFQALDDIYRLKNPEYEFAREKELIAERLSRILDRSLDKNQDFDGDGLADPGELHPNVWIANKFLERGDRSNAKQMLLQTLSVDPDEPQSLSTLEAMAREERLNVKQSASWNFNHKYVKNPFSLFHTCMAISYIIEEKRMPSPFILIGELFLRFSLHLGPEHPDPHLLKGWYHFRRGEAAEATACAKKAIELDPEYAKAWLGLGFFQAAADRPAEAAEAFKKSLELYPGYSQRRIILDLIDQLSSDITNNDRALQAEAFLSNR